MAHVETTQRKLNIRVHLRTEIQVPSKSFQM